MKEIWADVIGYEGTYQVSTWGRVRSVNGVLKPYVTEKGYFKIDLIKDGVRSKFRVHRLVAQTFIPNYANLSEVNHKDGNKQNNSVTNLEWVSPRRNIEHEREYVAQIMFNITAARKNYIAINGTEGDWRKYL